MKRLLGVLFFEVFICLLDNSTAAPKPTTTAMSRTTNVNTETTHTSISTTISTERMKTGVTLNTAYDVADSMATDYVSVSGGGEETTTTTMTNIVIVDGTSEADKGLEDATATTENEVTGGGEGVDDGGQGNATATMQYIGTGDGGDDGDEGQEDATATMENGVTEEGENGDGDGDENDGGGGGEGGNGDGNGNDPYVVYTISGVVITNPDDAIFGLGTGQNVNVDVSVAIPSSSGPVTGTSNWACYLALTNGTTTRLDDDSVHDFLREEATIEPAANVGKNLAAGEKYTFSAVATLSMVNITTCEYTHLCVMITPHADATFNVNYDTTENIKCAEVMCGVAAMKLHLALVAVVWCIHALHKGLFCF